MAIDYNRQYVGARYVPQFFNNPNGSWDWAQGFQYEPLTIVKYGENTYTSKTLVPATVGSPNLNTEYWANTGNYNGAINQLQSEIELIADKLKYGDSLQSLNVLFIGDSYATKEYTNWADAIVNWVTSVGGVAQSGVISGTNWNGTYAPAYITALQTADNKQDLKQIIIAGGVNEIYDYNTAENAVKEFMLYVKNNCPLARVYFIFMGKINGSYIKDGKTYTQTDVINAYRVIRKLCGENGIIWGLYAQEILHDTRFFSVDTAHPDITAQNNIVTYLKNAVQGHFTPTYTQYGDENSIASVIVDNGITKLLIQSSNLLLVENISWLTNYPLPNIAFPAGFDNYTVNAIMKNEQGQSMPVYVNFREYLNRIEYSFSADDIVFPISNAISLQWSNFAVLTNSSELL